MKVRLVFQLGKGRLEAGAADERHVRSKALFDIEALLREQPRQVRIDFEERVVRLDLLQIKSAPRSSVGGQVESVEAVLFAATSRSIWLKISVFISFTLPTKAAVMCRFSFGVTLPPASFSRRASEVL